MQPSRDVDSRKLILAVVLDQGLAKKTQEKRAFMQTKVVMWIHAN
jgi:hypothetical protein